MTLLRMEHLQRRIRRFAMLGVLLAGLVVGAVTGIPLYMQAREHSEEAAHAQIHAQAQGVAQYFSRLTDVALQLTSRSVIRDWLEQYNRGEVSRQALEDFSVPRLQDALRQSADVVGMLRLDARGEAVLTIGKPLAPALWAPLAEIADGAQLHGPVRIDGEYFLLVGAPIVNRDNAQVGTDIIAFQLGDLRRLLLDKQPFSLPASQYLITPTGEMLQVNAATLFQPVPAGRLAPLTRLAADRKDGMRTSADSALFYEPMADAPGWGMAVQIAQKDLYLPVQKKAVLPAVVILLMVLLTTWLIARLIRPLMQEVVDASRALAEGENRLRTLIDATPDIISFKDGEGRWLEVNRAKLALHGLLGVDYRGRRDTELAAFVPEAYRSAFLACRSSDEEAWQAGSILRNEEIIPNLQGEERIYDVMKIPVFSSRGERDAMVVLGRDVTRRRQVELALRQSAQEWSYAMNFFGDAVCLLDLQDRMVRANSACCRLFGLDEEAIIGRDIAQLLHPQGEKTECALCRARRLHEDVHLIIDVGEEPNIFGYPIEVSVQIIRDPMGAPSGALMGIRDLTQSRQMEERLILAASVFESSQEGIMILDTDHRIIEVNQAFSRITGHPAASVAGRPLGELLNVEQSEILGLDKLWSMVDEYDGWQGEIWYRRRSGEVFPAWHNFSPVRNKQGSIVRYTGSFTDISDKKAAERRINYLAHYDLLTGLPNRVLLQDRLQNALERMRRSGLILAILFLDLDRFKNVNDSLGHPVGDRLLQEVGQRLGQSVREQDTVARLGGDEFLIILDELRNPQYAALIARKLLKNLNEEIRIEGHSLFIGASIGISLFPADGEDVDTLIKNADTAMYRAKDLGRNNYQFYTPELTVLSLERFELERDLRQALERNELQLYYQPQTAHGQVYCTGVEALLRWQHPQKGMIPPDRFIPLAEDTGLIHALGDWVLQTACRQARDWQQQGRPLRMAVNLSALQVIHGDIVAQVRKVLQTSRLDPRYLELEITEGFMFSHAEQGVKTLEQLKALGVTLAIDDFGTGYSSLNYLKRLPIDRLKIDRSFVQGVPEDRDDAAIVTTIIAMARNLQLEVIAEGVETEAQLTFLSRQGCLEYQGYLFGRPMALQEFEAYSKAQGQTNSGARDS